MDTDLTLDDLRTPPVTGDAFLAAWHRYLDCFDNGDRRSALAAVDAAVDAVPAQDRDAFARWVCESLFDRSRDWSGQWGGGLRRTDGSWHRPAGRALTATTLSVRVLLPYLAGATSPRERVWLERFAAGQQYRLPPDAREVLRKALGQR